jgi:hypothetical protein
VETIIRYLMFSGCRRFPFRAVHSFRPTYRAANCRSAFRRAYSLRAGRGLRARDGVAYEKSTAPRGDLIS